MVPSGWVAKQTIYTVRAQGWHLLTQHQYHWWKITKRVSYFNHYN